jgi:hypothetical protein
MYGFPSLQIFFLLFNKIMGARASTVDNAVTARHAVDALMCEWDVERQRDPNLQRSHTYDLLGRLFDELRDAIYSHDTMMDATIEEYQNRIEYNRTFMQQMIAIFRATQKYEADRIPDTVEAFTTSRRAPVIPNHNP